MYFFKPISDEVRLSQIIFNKHKKTMKLILVSIFACIAAILQAAGVLRDRIFYKSAGHCTYPVMFHVFHSIRSNVLLSDNYAVIHPTAN